MPLEPPKKRSPPAQGKAPAPAGRATPGTTPGRLEIKAVAPKQSRIDRVFRALWSRLSPDDAPPLDWSQDADRAVLEAEPLRARALLYVIAAVVLSLILWAGLADIDQVTRGEGKVIPSRQVQIVQSVDGGVVTEILVAEGDVVEPGELLLRLDATRFASTLRENRAEMLVLEARAARLRAITQGVPFDPSEELRAQIPEVIEQEAVLFQSTLDERLAARTIAEQQLEQRQREHEGAVARLRQAKRGLELASRELDVTRPLFDSGAVSEVELLRLEREVTRLRGDRAQAQAETSQLEAAIREARRKIEEVELGFLNAQREELAEVTGRINSMREGERGLSDRVKQTEVRSPVRGTVKRLFQNTIGGVVLPGKEVCEIVPLDDTLLLEARIRPKDIAFLRPEQPALVKFTAYDFVVYGGLDAVVEHIGADTVMDEHGNPFYTVRVRTLESSLGEGMPIIPGMVAEVDVLTGKKTILASLLKPVLRAKQYALSER